MDHEVPLPDQGHRLQAPMTAVGQGPVTEAGPQTLSQIVITEAPSADVRTQDPGVMMVTLVQVLLPRLYVGTDQAQ